MESLEKGKWGKWKIGIVYQSFKAQDGVTKGDQIWAGRSYLEWPIQYLYPLQLNCDVNQYKDKWSMCFQIHNDDSIAFWSKVCHFNII